MAIELPHITHYSDRAIARVGRALSRLIEGENRGRLRRWFFAGLTLISIRAVPLFFLVDLLKLSVPIATLVAAEGCTLLRFAANYYWVFSKAQSDHETLRPLSRSERWHLHHVVVDR